MNVEPELVVPILTDNLQGPAPEPRATAAYLLSVFGEDGRPAVPALLSLLSDADKSVRTAATNALLKIAPEVLTNTPTK